MFNFFFIFRTFTEFNEYFYSYWIVEVKPVNFCVAKVQHRTNNYLESFNAKASRIIGNGPNIVNFLINLQKIATFHYTMFLGSKEDIKKKGKKPDDSILKSEKLVEYLSKLQSQKRFTVKKFLLEL